MNVHTSLTSQIFIIEGSIHVDNVEDFLEKIKLPECGIALLNADYIVDRGHAELAARKAIDSWREGKNVARTLPIEIMLYASANRQINQALEMGVKSNSENKVVAVLVGEEDCISKFKVISGFREEKVLNLDEDKVENLKRFFDINEEELNVTGREKLPDIIKERIVLFDLFK
ncbi:MAG: KEOPS complex subunit Cgi121 [Archaeoglobaceae archaeon]